MNVLITGSSGFLGRTITCFLKDDYNIFELSHSDEINSIRLDKDVPKFSQCFEMVLHIAGKAHSIPRSVSEKQEFYDVNVVGTRHLLEGLTNSCFPKYFIFISSVAVYGKVRGCDIDENALLNGIDAYGSSKIEAERIVIDWCKEHNVICTILRLPLVVGPNPPGNLGSMIKSIQKGYYFNIAGGKAKRSMVLAEDVAKSIAKVANIGGIYNLSDGYNPSFAELGNHISAQFGKGKPRNMPMWLARVFAKLGDLFGNGAPLNTNKLLKITSDLTFNDSKAREAFGWNPTPVLDGFKIQIKNEADL
ncbi:MAG: NAD-dependent epimerase/dehydratase family protein [Cryomorphaceae bacterium]|nr:NAD-dependent epimerase/dehydratase family protein [Cryomorphaceae bacterium]